MDDVRKMSNEKLVEKLIGSWAVSVADAGPIPPPEKRQRASEAHKTFKAELLRRLDATPQICPVCRVAGPCQHTYPQMVKSVTVTNIAPNETNQPIRVLLEGILRNDVKESDGAHWEYPESELLALLDALTPKVAELVKGRLDAPAGRFGELDEITLNEIVRDVAELPDRDSPDSWPEAMLVTGEELKEIIRERLAYPRPASQPTKENNGEL